MILIGKHLTRSHPDIIYEYNLGDLRRTEIDADKSQSKDASKLGWVRWVVERTVSWLLRFKRLGLRYDRTEKTLRPLLLLVTSIINLRRLIQSARFRDQV